MNSEKYIEDRLVNQITWYEKKSAANKKRHLLTKNGTMILSASILLLAIFIQTDTGACINFYLQIAFGIIGFILLVINGWSLAYNHQDQWNHYRSVAEELKHEKNLYKNRSGVYRNSKYPEELLVERVESIISPRHSS